jgi:DnaJ-class molecular chaperone
MEQDEFNSRLDAGEDPYSIVADEHRRVECPTCGGLGLTGERDEWGFGKPCPKCDGTGKA